MVVLFQTMLSFLVILFVRKLYVQNNTFKQRTYKNLCHVRLPYFVLRTNLAQHKLSQTNWQKTNCPIYLKEIFIFQSNQMNLGTFENIHRSYLSSNLNPRKLKAKWKAICRISIIRISITANLGLVYFINIAFYKSLEDITVVVITKPGKGNRAFILDGRLFDNIIQEIISDLFKVKKLNEHLILRREVSWLKRFLRKSKKKTFLMKTNTIVSTLFVLLLLLSTVNVKILH